MSDSESVKRIRRNGLHALASVGGVLIGLFLLAGAAGHFAAVWPAMDGATHSLGEMRLRLFLPGLMLAVPGLINIIVCRAVWIGRRWSVNLLLTVNIIAAGYLAYQLVQDLSGHPIGFFLALVSSYTVLLAAIRMGLVWPATVNGSVVSPDSRQGNNNPHR
jgi:hypothetical protein